MKFLKFSMLMTYFALEKNQEIISLNTQLDEYDKQINVELNELKTKNKKLKKTLAKLTETLNYLEAKRVVK